MVQFPLEILDRFHAVAFEAELERAARIVDGKDPGAPFEECDQKAYADHEQGECRDEKRSYLICRE